MRIFAKSGAAAAGKKAGAAICSAAGKKAGAAAGKKAGAALAAALLVADKKLVLHEAQKLIEI